MMITRSHKSRKSTNKNKNSNQRNHYSDQEIKKCTIVLYDIIKCKPSSTLKEKVIRDERRSCRVVLEDIMKTRERSKTKENVKPIEKKIL